MRLTEDERKKANMLAHLIDCSEHEWPKDQHEIQLLCHGYLDRVADNHALRTRIADLEAGSAKYREWLGRALDKQKEYLEQCQVLIAERDAAKAGEARAVEALEAANEAAEDWHFSVGWEGRECTQAVLNACQVGLSSTQPALDWLAQREREAVVRELEQLMKNEWIESFELKARIRTRIAALTNQQPTACSRSEVRGEESNE